MNFKLAPLRKLFAHQMLQAWQPVLGLSMEENDRAVESGFAALKEYETNLRRHARQVLDQLEREDCIGIVMLGRPYHHDPSLNHRILDEFQKLGYPIFLQNTLPIDEDLLERLFGDEVRAGVISSPLDIGDASKNSYSCSNQYYLTSSFDAKGWLTNSPVVSSTVALSNY